jgi:hypothetical protein
MKLAELVGVSDGNAGVEKSARLKSSKQSPNRGSWRFSSQKLTEGDKSRVIYQNPFRDRLLVRWAVPIQPGFVFV